MSLLEEAQKVAAFKMNVEELALEELLRLDLIQTDLQGQLVLVQNEIKAVKAVLRATSINGPKLKKPVAKKPQAAFAMGEEREAELIEWLTGNDDEITSKAARYRFPDWAPSYVNSALKELRETGVLRLAATSGGMNVYRSMV